MQDPFGRPARRTERGRELDQSGAVTQLTHLGSTEGGPLLLVSHTTIMAVFPDAENRQKHSDPGKNHQT